MKTIAALVDFSDLTFKVLRQAETLAKAFNSQVIILHMVPGEPVLVGDGILAPAVVQAPSPQVLDEHYSKLVEMRDSLEKFGVSADIQQLAGTSVEEVLAVTRKMKADLIILGSHQHSAFYNLLIGSVTGEVLKRAHCPVLVVPSDEDAENKQIQTDDSRGEMPPESSMESRMRFFPSPQSEARPYAQGKAMNTLTTCFDQPAGSALHRTLRQVLWASSLMLQHPFYRHGVWIVPRTEVRNGCGGFKGTEVG